MLDFVDVVMKQKRGAYEIEPCFKVIRSKDLMIRGGSFYAIWNEKENRWTTDEFDAINLIDQCTLDVSDEKYDAHIPRKLLREADNGLIDKWKKYCQKQAIDNFKQLDETLIFSNMTAKRSNYSSKSLNYPLEPGKHDSWDEILSVLYDEEERHKIEWCIGAIVSGDSKKLQKFLVFYGSAGTGKSTIINIIQDLFDGYYSVFDSKKLGANSSFALEMFKTNPLVAIQHDGDLSRIEDNTLLNSLVSHEEMSVNEKFKAQYMNKFKAFLIMGTNKPVKITDAKSGILRRLIDVKPTGNKIPPHRYDELMENIKFELGAIAYHCLEVYKEDKRYYNNYTPMGMIEATNDFYNFISDNFEYFEEEKDITLSLAWKVYKEYVEDANMPYPLSKRAFREELKNYFSGYEERYYNPTTGKRTRNLYINFLVDKFADLKVQEPIVGDTFGFDLSAPESLFDKNYGDYKAQYAKEDGTPSYKWDNVRTTLKDIDTKQLHYVKIPENHIVIDFDIPDENGNKCLTKNLEAASKWPKTYTELSKSGAGVHLHYIYTGDATKLSRVYDDHIEIKVFTGNSSLRRKLTRCNAEPISTIASGLPLKKENKKMVGESIIKNEKMLRIMILRNLNKEYHNATKPSIDFINKLLNDAYESGLHYDVTDMRPAILTFAIGSTHQAENCIKIVNNMKFKSEEPSAPVEAEKDTIVFYDIEVFPNLFLVNWKYQGEGKQVMRMINPKPSEIEQLTRFKLVGFNNRRYDNHILYARMMGYSVPDLFELSQRIINGSPNAMFSEAYNLSYTDVYDFASAPNKKSLKKWEIELGIKHHELGLPWDQPVPENMWTKVAEYCDDDVLATEAVFNHLSADFDTRKILSEIAGKTVNDSTNSLTTAIVFDGNKKPQNEFNYRDMSKPVTSLDLTDETMDFLKKETKLLDKEFIAWDGTRSMLPCFPGYKFVGGKSTYRGLEAGEGGYVEAQHGYHENVALLDVASMHPHSIIAECLFGPKYTKRFKDLVDGRISIKHKDFEKARSILDGKFAPYVVDDDVKLAILSTALKTPINSVYGLTSAGFTNPFRDNRNVDNIVAKRGALFMIDLKYEVEKRGFTVAHIKTDSIKIPNATREIIDFVMEFGKKYGYEFEHEATYKKMCLVNNAVYIAKYASQEECKKMYGYIPKDNKKKENKWTATGTQFAVPYVFKTLFSHEEITIDDMCETKSVKTAMYLDFNENLPDVSKHEKSLEDSIKEYAKGIIPSGVLEEAHALFDPEIAKGHNYSFIGKVGCFCPIKEGHGGGLLVREALAKDGSIKYDAVTGTKGFRWANAETIKELNKIDSIDKRFYQNLVDDAIESIGKYTDAEAFIE